MTFYPHLGWKQNSYKLIILSYSNFLEFVLVFNVLQERNYGIYYQIKKNIEFCVPESPTTTIFTLSMFAAISWWYFNLSWSWNVSCAWTRNQIWSYFHFHFWFCLVYKHQSIWFYDVSYMVYLMKRFSIFCKL